MKLLVTGATGFIGLEVASQLAARGLRPRLMVRRPQRGMLLRGLDAEIVQADLDSEASLHRAVDGVEGVIHLAARATFESYRRVRPTIVEGSCRLLHVAAERGVGRFVFGGSLLVYGSQRRPIDPATPARPVIGYGRAKLEAEEALERIAADSGVRFGSLRLPHVYGPRSLLFERVHRGRVVFPGPMTNRYAHLHVADAARALIQAALTGWTGTAPIGDGSDVTWSEFVEVIRTYYPRLRVRSVPAWLARTAAAATAMVPWPRGPRLTTADTVTGFNLDLPVQSPATWRALGIAPLFPTVHEGIPATLDASIPFRWLHTLADRAA